MYTKGEWQKWSSPSGGHIWCGDKHIADTDGEDAIANAHLIASAPDCYEGLVEADRIICELCKRLNPQHEGCVWCEDRVERLKAIVKAEGGKTEPKPSPWGLTREEAELEGK